MPDLNSAVPDLVAAIRHWSACGSREQSAFVFLCDGERDACEISFAELDTHARAVAATLRRTTQPGDRVLIVSPPGLEYVSGLVGCLYAGVVAVPAYPSTFGGTDRDTSRLGSIIDQSRAAAICLTSDLEALARNIVASGAIDADALVYTDQVRIDAGDDWVKPATTPDTLAILQYTSGSTGRPKGVMLTHRNLWTNISSSARIFAITEQTRFVSWLPPYHDMGLIGRILGPLMAGAQCILMSPQAFLERPARWLEAITRYRGEISGGPNFAYEFCVRRISAEEHRRLDLSCWRVATNGAEPVRLATLERFCDAFGSVGFRREALRPAYGLAESTLVVSIGDVGDRNAARRLDAAGVEQCIARAGGAADALTYVSCGRPLEEAAIVDPRTRERCGPGQIGEIWLRGDSVARGYWDRPDETAETFAATMAHVGDAEPWLRTGDFGVMDDGELYIVGRLKDVLVVAGRNIHPHDLEATVQRSHHALRAGCGAAFQVRQDDEERIVLVQEVNPADARGAQRSICDAVRQAATEHHGIRIDDVVLISPRTLPKTTSGKIQRNGARAAYVAGTLARLDADPAQAAAVHSLVRTGSIEPVFRNILTAVLGLRAASLSGESRLSEIGLDSRSVLELRVEIEKQFGAIVPMRRFLDNPTIASLLRTIHDLAPAGAPATAKDAARTAAPAKPPRAGGTAHADFAFPGGAPPDVSGFGADRLPETMALLRRWVVEERAQPGVQLYVSRYGQPVTSVALGWARADVRFEPDTLVPWFCAVKPLLAIALAQLWEAGKVEIDAPVASVVPEFGTGAKARITFRHILSHTTSIRPDPLMAAPLAPRERQLRVLCGTEPDPQARLGRDAYYSFLWAWFMLAEAIERITGKSYSAQLAHTVSKPLNAEFYTELSTEEFVAIWPRVGLIYDLQGTEPKAFGPVSAHSLFTVRSPGTKGLGASAALGRVYEALLREPGVPGTPRLLRPQTVEALVRKERCGAYDVHFDSFVSWGLGFMADGWAFGAHCSPATFGHTGARGNVAFADPAHGLVVAFARTGVIERVASQTRDLQIVDAIYRDLGITQDHASPRIVDVNPPVLPTWGSLVRQEENMAQG